MLKILVQNLHMLKLARETILSVGEWYSVRFVVIEAHDQTGMFLKMKSANDG